MRYKITIMVASGDGTSTAALQRTRTLVEYVDCFPYYPRGATTPIVSEVALQHYVASAFGPHSTIEREGSQ